MTLFVIGDIHGRYNALVEVIEKSGFDKDRDELVILGDVVDGGFQAKECIEYLLTIPNRVFVIGNHDVWVRDWFLTGREDPLWVHQGGHATMVSYGMNRKNVPQSHIDFIRTGILYTVNSSGRIYVHGGFDPGIPLEDNPSDRFLWDRDIIQYAKHRPIPRYTHVYIGHTTTQLQSRGCMTPITYHNLTMMDTGAGWDGKLTIMNVETREYWQSERQVPGGR